MKNHPKTLRIRLVRFVGAAIVTAICSGCQLMPDQQLPCDACWAAEKIAMSTMEPSELQQQQPAANLDSPPPVPSTRTANVQAVSIASTRPPEIQAPQNALPTRSRLRQSAAIQQQPMPEVVPVGDISAGQVPAGPQIGGLHLGATQMTATEHALRLQEENTQLKTVKAALQADNQRLQDQLRQTDALLDRITSAVTAARLELGNAEKANQQLQRKVAELENQRMLQQRDRDRLLESIRDELDDALMREIASQRK